MWRWKEVESASAPDASDAVAVPVLSTCGMAKLSRHTALFLEAKVFSLCIVLLCDYLRNPLVIKQLLRDGTLLHKEYTVRTDLCCCVCSGGRQLIRAFKHGRVSTCGKSLPCLLSISRLPRSHQVGHTMDEEEEELTGQQASPHPSQLQ